VSLTLLVPVEMWGGQQLEKVRTDVYKRQKAEVKGGSERGGTGTENGEAVRLVGEWLVAVWVGMGVGEEGMREDVWVRVCMEGGGGGGGGGFFPFFFWVINAKKGAKIVFTL